MSTRAVVHFVNDWEDVIIYRHSDGYPEGLGQDLKTFFADVRANVADNRFDDPSYLAAKFVVWQAARYAHKYLGRGIYRPAHYLDFLGVGVVAEEPGDIEYRYLVRCEGANTPEITTEEVSGDRSNC